MIIAGPNGAGKTTFAREYLPHEVRFPDFINVDMIAAGLSPFAPGKVALRAGRLMLEEIQRRTGAGASFAFETTLSGRSYAGMIPRWRKAGYHVKLISLSLPSPDLAIARVAQGGHSVEDETIRLRFDVGMKNFHRLYKHTANSWVLYDNSGLNPVSLGQEIMREKDPIQRPRYYRLVAGTPACRKARIATRIADRHPRLCDEGRKDC